MDDLAASDGARGPLAAGAARAVREARGSTALRLTGAESLAVLNRVTTQRLDDLAPGEARTTLWCDFRGRLQHRALVARGSDGAVWLLREDAPGAELAAQVDRAVFREDVRIEDRSAGLPVALVLADHATTRIDETPVLIALEGGLAIAVGDAIGRAASASEADRIRRGRARHGAEVVLDYTPYEANLGAHVHLAKGCYTGQEALQRLVTYASVRRRLVRFDGAGEAPAPGELLADGAGAGRLTSVATAPDGWTALAVVRIAALQSGAALALESGRQLAPPHEFPIAQPVR
ncbi:MAG TPA: hypothetical protein VMH61_07230 [Candidatus Acidoferrales bacterium]|nr:hypothetical protein [Candidatus Acidoferrales bacterium]